MHRLFLLFTLVFCLAATRSQAQQKTDSLRALLPVTRDDSVKCIIIQHIIAEFKTTGPADSAIYYGHLLRKSAHTIRHTAFGIEARKAIGLAHASMGQTDSAILNYHYAISLCQPGKDDFTKASLLNSIGANFEKTDDYDSAFNYYLKTIEVLRTLNMPLYIARTKNNIGNIFFQRRDLAKALQYYSEALTEERTLNDSLGMPMALINVANVYNQLGNADSGLVAMNEAIAIYNIQGNKSGEALALSNLSIIHRDRGELEKALAAANRSLTLNTAVGSGYQKSHSLFSIAKIYAQMKEYDQAIAMYHQGLLITDQLSLKSIAADIHQGLSTAHKAKANYKEALRHAEVARTINDSLFHDSKNKLVAEYEARYESDKKNQQLAVLQKNSELQESEIKRKTIQQYALIGGSALTALLGLSLFRVYQFRQTQKQKLLDQQLAYEKLEAERLQELDESKSRFFTNIAHEFRTPLTLIQAPAEMIHDETKEMHSKTNAQLILNNASRLLSLTNQLLDLSKLEAGMLKLQPVTIDFIAFAKGCVFSFETLADENDIALSFESTTETLKMDFDPEKTAVILNNLVSNAVKFTRPAGTVTVHVAAVSETPSRITVTIADSGIGIDPDMLPRIFDRFYQTDDSLTRKAQGTGIGLALVKELTELHEGTISVSSQQGAGTTFTLTLPQRQAKSLVAAEVIAANEPSLSRTDHTSHRINPVTDAHPGSAHPYTILVVEDNAEVRNFIVSMLEQHYQVLEAENGKAGLPVAIEQVPDLIISDVMMPEMDGYTYCRQVKGDPRTSHIPVIMLTAKTGMDSKVEGLESGADDFLPKPFHGKELLARIRNLIHIRKQLQRRYSLPDQDEGLPKQESKFITQLRTVIDDHIDEEEFSVDDLATTIGMSRTQVHRKLKALTGQSTTQFVRQYKMEKAIAMLRAKEHNVSEVAFKLGFSSLAYFSTSFTQHFGFAPSDVSKSRI